MSYPTSTVDNADDNHDDENEEVDFDPCLTLVPPTRPVWQKVAHVDFVTNSWSHSIAASLSLVRVQLCQSHSSWHAQATPSRLRPASSGTSVDTCKTMLLE
jgi:hypothetical protein